MYANSNVRVISVGQPSMSLPYTTQASNSSSSSSNTAVVVHHARVAAARHALKNCYLLPVTH